MTELQPPSVSLRRGADRACAVARVLVLVTAVLSPSEGLSQSTLVTAEPGTIPILLTVPHGGVERVPGVPERSSGVTVRDGYTIELAQRAADRIEAVLGKRPYVVIAEFHRKYIDANRAPEEAFEDPDAAAHYRVYHDAVRAFVAEIRASFPAGAVLLDVHGQSKNGFRDKICRGTRNGQTVTTLRRWFGDEGLIGPDSILGRLRAAGLSVFPATLGPTEENSCFNGGFTVTEYGSHRSDGIDAIQLEVGGDLRGGARDDVADALGDAVSHFLDVLVAPSCPLEPVADETRSAGDTSPPRWRTATDALFILRVALGLEVCPPCICDVDDSGVVTAADALLALESAIGTP